MKIMRSAVGRGMVAAGVALASLIWQPAPVWAADQASQQNATATASGEVRRVDATAGKVAIKHDAISDLGLPAMTLVYQASPVLLVNIKPGDHVRFTVTRQDGTYVVTQISN